MPDSGEAWEKIGINTLIFNILDVLEHEGGVSEEENLLDGRGNLH